MKVFRNKAQAGSSIIEYILPIALIGIVVGLGLFYMFAEGKMTGFFSKSGNVVIDSSGNATLNKNLIEETNLISDKFNLPEDGSISKECQNGVCDIDYGEFVLKGVPSNLNNYIQSNGASGGTEKMLSLLEQIAQQQLEQGHRQQAVEIMNLANSGHAIAAMEKELETIVNNCNGQYACLEAMEDQPIPKPEGFDIEGEWTMSELGNLFAVGCARIFVEGNPSKRDLTNTPAANFVKNFDKVINNPDINDTTKGVIQELYWQIGAISEDFESTLYTAYHEEIEIRDTGCIDPITGKSYKNTELNDDIMKAISEYQTSRLTDFDSTLICATGSYKDSGKKCH